MMEKKKAIVFTRFPYESAWGGEESHTLNLAKYVQSHGFEPIFFGSCPILLQKFSELGFTVRNVWGGKMIVTPLELLKSFFLFPFMLWNLRRNFRALLREFDIKALYCLSLNEKLFLSPLVIRNKIPVTWVEHQEIRSWLLKNPWKFLYRSNAGYVKVVPIGKKNFSILKNVLKIPEDNLSPILHGVDVGKIENVKCKMKKGLIVYANRLIPKKGVQDFLVAVLPLLEKNPELQVKVIGEGELKNEVERFFPVQSFLKNEKWYEMLSQADIFVSCARDENETFSLSTAEAMAAGCKVVVTTCCGIADYLTDKKNAFLVESNDPEDLSRGISEALSSSDEIREQAIGTAREKFDQEKMLLAYESVILRS